MDLNQEIKPSLMHLSSSSLVALKAELLSKQAQVQKAREAGLKTIHPKAAKKVKEPNEKKNSGVDLRAQKDEEQLKEEEPTLEKSRIILEEKAKLYEKLVKDKSLLDEDTITEDNSTFLVDFQQKVVKETLEERKIRLQDLKHSKASSPQYTSEGIEESSPPSTPFNFDEEWVDFVDSLGRTRRCLRKDLAFYQQQDQEFYQETGKSAKNVTYGNFVKPSQENRSTQETGNPLNVDEDFKKNQRLQWEEEEAVNSNKSNIHYQDILFQEARQHGVGFYSFSKNEEERAKQMEELERLRRQTEVARAQVAQTAAQKRDLLEARLQKVRDRKRAKLGLPLKDTPILQAVQTTLAADKALDHKETDATKEAEEKLRLNTTRSLPQSAKIRPWDLGKEGVPKKEVLSQEAWVEKRREERVAEFAPPTIYGKDRSSLKHQNRKISKEVAGTSEDISLNEDSIAAGLAFFKEKTYSESDEVSPCKVDNANEVDDEVLLPPGESDYCSLDDQTKIHQPGRQKGASIPPPTFMDYYVGGSRKPKIATNSRYDLQESFSIGIKHNKEIRK